MARTITMREAINEALDQEMARDSSVVLMGEDIVGGAGSPGEDDAWGGVLGVTKGLYAKYGRERLLDTPLSESAYIGAAIGAAACGLRPVAELMFIDFMGVCFDQIYNQAAKFRYMFGGKAETPVTIRAMVGAGFRAAAQHSQMLTPIFTHIPGLKVVCPSTPYDTKGLLTASIRDNDPVIFCEHKAMYDMAGEVPEAPYTIPLGEAEVIREGGDCTVVAYGLMVHKALEAADLLATESIDSSHVVYHINPSGRFVTGGPQGDCGLTGRKIIVDTYGGWGRHGGGAFSGKDPSKVDRSASYAARHIAKNIVAAELAQEAEVQLAYAIGVAEPVSVYVDTFGTGQVDGAKLVRAVRETFPLTPRGMIEALDLRRPMYRNTASYGHFGREEDGFTWEKRDRVEQLKSRV